MSNGSGSAASVLTFPIMREVKGFVHPQTGEMYRLITAKEAKRYTQKIHGMVDGKARLDYFVRVGAQPDVPEQPAATPAATPPNPAPQSAAAKPTPAAAGTK